jgi:ribokinase
MERKKLHVLGSLNIDIVVRVDSLPLPGQTVQGGDLAVLLGGKGANQAVAAARVGADVSMFGAIGSQAFGLDPLSLMTGYGVDVSAVAKLSGATGAAMIAVDAQGENMIAVSPGANGRIRTPPPVSADTILLAQLETSPQITLDWFNAGRAKGCLTILNAAPALAVPDGLFAATDILIVNETELATYSGSTISGMTDEADIVTAARSIRQFARQQIIITRGSRGALAMDRDSILSIPAKPAKVRDTTGAGDCFCGALAASLADGMSLSGALEFASAAAAISVTREGAAPSMPVREEVAP